MNDADLIVFLREQAFGLSARGDPYKDAPKLREAADRLEALAAPPEGSPLTAERLGEIRDYASDYAPSPVMPIHRNLCDLLAAHDHAVRAWREAEAWCVAMTDRDGYQQGHAAGVAEALAVLSGVEHDLRNSPGADAGGRLQLTDMAAGVKRAYFIAAEQCGPATPPPFSALLALAQKAGRYEAALRRIVDELADLAPGDDMTTVRIAREALEGKNDP